MSEVQFENVTAKAVANVYFEGKVVSHTILLSNGERKTLGIIYPGSFEFNVGTKERMDITSGTAKVRLSGEAEFKVYEAGSVFFVPENSKFEISVEAGIAQYVCSFG